MSAGAQGREAMQVHHRLMGAAGIAVAALLVAGCDFGETGDATRVADTSAQLRATVNTDDPGTTLTWWFEYGPTTSLGTSTPQRSVTFPATSTTPVSVSATVTGLAEGTTYHYRACVRNVRGGGVCGAIKTLTTTSGRDSVHGSGVSFEIIETGFAIGADIDATSLPNGSSPAGRASRSPGEYYPRIWDAGPVTCLRVAGDQATVGFIGDYTDFGQPPVYLVVYVDDNGPTGDRFAVDQIASVPTSCPVPGNPQDAAWQTLIRGDFVVHDHP